MQPSERKAIRDGGPDPVGGWPQKAKLLNACPNGRGCLPEKQCGDCVGGCPYQSPASVVPTHARQRRLHVGGAQGCR